MWTNIDEIETAIQNFAATHPAIAERIALPEQAVSADAGVSPRTVSALRIGAQAADAADGALLIFGQHAREWVPPEVALLIIASSETDKKSQHRRRRERRPYTVT